MICLSGSDKIAAVKKLKVLISENPKMDFRELMKIFYNSAYEDLIQNNDKTDTENFVIELIKYLSQDMYSRLSDYENENKFIQVMKILTGESDFSYNVDDMLALQRDENVRELVGLNKKKEIKRTPQVEITNELDTIISEIRKTFPQTVSSYPFLPIVNKNPLFKGTNVKGLEIDKGEFFDVEPLFRPSSVSNGKLPKNEFEGEIVYQEPLEYGNLIDFGVRYFINNRNKSFEEVKAELLNVNIESGRNFRKMFSKYISLSHTPPDNIQETNIFKDYISSFIDDIIYTVNEIEQKYKDYYLTDLASLGGGFFPIYDKNINSIGSIDLVAIKSDGSYVVIDIKTGKDLLEDRIKDKYNTQISIYNEILKNVPSLKSENKAEIVYVHKDVFLGNGSISNIKKERYTKTNLKNMSFVTLDAKSLEQIKEIIDEYKKDFYKEYNPLQIPKLEEVKKPTGQKPKFGNMLQFIAAKEAQRAKMQQKKPLTSKIKQSEKLSTPESIKLGVQWLKRIFPELGEQDIQVVKTLLSDAGGEFYLNAIYLAEKSNEGVAFHEGWHRFTQLYLTLKEKETLYNRVKERGIDFTTRDGRNANSKTASFEDIEEYLADEFKNYAINRDGYSFESLGEDTRNIFQKIWDFIMALLGFERNHGRNSFEKLFKELYFGTYYKGNFSINNAMFSYLRSIYKDNKGNTVIDNQSTIKFISLLDRVIADKALNDSLLINDKYISSVKSFNDLKQVLLEGLIEIGDWYDNLYENDYITAFQKVQRENIKKILEPTNIGNFIKLYMKYTGFESLRQFYEDNINTINKEIAKDTLSNIESQNDEGADEVAKKGEVGPEIEYDRSGETDAFKQARKEIKDFFNGIPILDVTNTSVYFRPIDKDGVKLGYNELYLIDEYGLPKTMDKRSAFYKALEILSNSPKWDILLEKLNNTENYYKFPELQILRDRLLGAKYESIGIEGEKTIITVEGIIPKMNRLSELVKSGNATEEEIQEHTSLMGFHMHFLQIMGMPQVDVVTIKVDTSKDTDVVIEDEGSKQFMTPVQLVKNTDITISNLMTQMGIDFQKNASKGKDKTLNVYQALEILNSNDAIQLQRVKFLYDDYLNITYFNPFYGLNIFNDIRLERENQILSQNQKTILKEFYSSLGVEIDDYLLTNPKHLRQLVKNYNGLRQVKNQMADMSQNIFNYNKRKITFNLSNLQDEQKQALQSIIKNVFASNPIDKFIYLGQERVEKKGDIPKIFGRNTPLLIELASLQRETREHYSSGSVLTKQGSQFTYYMQNQMLLIRDLINSNQLNSFEDFDKYEEIAHLNPLRNRAMKEDLFINQLFDKSGKRKKNINLRITVIGQQTQSTIEGEKIETLVSEFSKGQKMLADFFLTRLTGSSEVRRMETSNTAWRISILDELTNKEIKFLDIQEAGFKDVRFLLTMRGYIQSAAFMYRFHKGKNDSKTKKGNVLGIFEEMLGDSLTKEIKKEIDARPKEFDLNNLFNDIMQKGNQDLIDRINDRISDFFEMISFGNKDGIDEYMGGSSYHKMMSDEMSNEDFTLVKKIIEYGRKFRGTTPINLGTTPQNKEDLFNNEVFKMQIRDFVANDIVMALQDSKWFFGDYTYFSDAIKRRKIIGNNGSTHVLDGDIKRAVEAQFNSRSLRKTYREFNELGESTKDVAHVRKTVLADPKVPLDYQRKIIEPLIELHAQRGDNLTRGEIERQKKATIESWSKVELANAGAYISLDIYRLMRLRERLWSEEDEKEYVRQNLILEWKLYGERHKRGYLLIDDFFDKEGNFIEDNEWGFSNEEVLEIHSKGYSSFNVAKYALTGPVLSEDMDSPLRPVFDKMGLKVLLPETDFEQKRNLFKHMYENDVDYVVYESGSKGYVSHVSNAWNENKQLPLPADYDTHYGMFFKHQQNTSPTKDKAVLANQLRGTFFATMILHPELRSKMEPIYNNFMRSLSKILDVKSSNTLASIGIDGDGNFIMEDGVAIGKRLFVEKIRQKVIDVNPSAVDLLDTLDVDKDGNFINFIETISHYQAINNVVSGLLDDAFRKVELNGSKYYQTPEKGSYLKFNAGKKNTDSSLNLNWHTLTKDENGKIVGVAECECKIAFSKNWEPLFNLPDKNSKPIKFQSTFKERLDLLNKLMSDKEWMDLYKESFILVGVRIPLQDLNFVSHLVVREFLAPVEGDTIILPPEFYVQVGSDNDIDTVTSTYKYLDPATGLPIKEVTENYSDILNEIIKLQEELNSLPEKPTEKFIEAPSFIDTSYLIRNYSDLYTDRGYTVEDMIDDLSYDKSQPMYFKGYGNNKSLLSKLFKENAKKNAHSEFFEDVQDIIDSWEQDMGYYEYVDEDDITDQRKIIKQKLRELNKKRKNYIKGLTNNIVDSVVEFYRQPESFFYLTETDDMSPILEMAQKIVARITGKPLEEVQATLNQSVSSLKSIMKTNDIQNHTNNFGIRSQLGSWVKFGRLLITLSLDDNYLNRNYKSQSKANLRIGKDLYDRTIRNPFSSDFKENYQFGLYDENGDRINKKVSMLVSTLLDLFKNPDIYPSLGISWDNIKQAIFLTALKVPIEIVMDYMTNPIVKEIESTKNKLGDSFDMRHAIVEAGKQLFGNEVFDSSSNENFLTFEANDPQLGPYKFTHGHFKIAEIKLREIEQGIETKFDIDEINNFTAEFNEYKRNNKGGNLKTYIQSNPEKKEMIKKLFLYQILLIEDGNNFYDQNVKYLNRDSVKFNNESVIFQSFISEKAIANSGMFNINYLDNIRKNTPFSPFYNDNTVLNVLNLQRENIFSNGIVREKFNELLEKLMTETYLYSDQELKKFVTTLYSDFIENIYKNFYILSLEQTYKDVDGITKTKTFKNFLEEFFLYDTFVDIQRTDINQAFIDEKAFKEKVEGFDEDAMYSWDKFPNQLDHFLAKYPELRELEIFKILNVRTLSSKFNPQRWKEEYKKPEDDYIDEEGRDEQSFEEDNEDFKSNKQETPMNISEVLDMFRRVYISANFSKDPQKRESQEAIASEDLSKLLKFHISDFTQLNIPEERQEIYEDDHNISEIKNFVRTLSYYSFLNASHIDRSRGSFSSIIPYEIKKEVIEKSIKNFNNYANNWTPNQYQEFFDGFQNIFKQMHPEYKFRLPKGGVFYSKQESGKLYNWAYTGTTSTAVSQAKIDMMTREGVNKENNKNHFSIRDEKTCKI